MQLIKLLLVGAEDSSNNKNMAKEEGREYSVRVFKI